MFRLNPDATGGVPLPVPPFRQGLLSLAHFWRQDPLLPSLPVLALLILVEFLTALFFSTPIYNLRQFISNVAAGALYLLGER